MMKPNDNPRRATPALRHAGGNGNPLRLPGVATTGIVVGPSRTEAPTGSRVHRPAGAGRGVPQVTKLGCLSAFDYRCQDRTCDIWHACQHGGNRD